MPKKGSRRASGLGWPVEPFESRRLLAADFATLNANPYAVVAMDVDGNGLPDLISADRGGSSVSVLSGFEGGSYFSSVLGTPSSGTAPTALAVGNFDNNGLPDLAVANYGSSTVRIFSANGSTLQNGPALTVGTNPVSLVAADFNSDGRVDLATANAGGSVSLLLGNGGSFLGASNFGTSTPLVSAAAGDFNHDGEIDLAVLGPNGTVTILFSSGAGSSAAAIFPTRATVALGTNGSGLAAGDFNGDGRTDLAVANNNASGTVSVALANGNGTFAAATTVPVGANPTNVIAGDLNADGKTDLVAANGGAGTLSVLLGRGNGTFAAAPAVAVGTNPTGLLISDLNNDGRVDLVATNNAAPGSVSARYGLGDGTFIGTPFGSPSVAPAPASVTATATADVNNDGKIDTLVASGSANQVRVLFGNGSGGVGNASNVPFSGGPIGVVPGDYNGDGNIDLAVANASGIGGISVALGNGNGTFAAATNVGFDPAVGITGGDFNLDGRPDLAVISATANTLTLLRGNGAGGFSASTIQTAGFVTSPLAVTTGDFNGDGKPDLAVGGATAGAARVVPLLGDGSGAFFSAQAPLDAGATRNALAAGDFNGDGLDDLAAANFNTDTAAVFLSVGNGNYQNATYATGDSPSALAVADFTGDGRADLALTDRTGIGGNAGAVRILIGSRTFPVMVPWLLLPALPDAPTFGDLNGDGHLDLITTNATSTSLWPGQVPFFPYASAAGGVATVSGANGPVSIGQAKGSLTLAGPFGTQRLNASALRTLVLSGVNATVSDDLARANGGKIAVTVNADAVATIAATQHLTTLTVNGAAAMAAGRKLLRVTGLNVAGKLDLNDSDLIYDYAAPDGQAATVAGLIGSGRAGGAWTGLGLTSTAARTDAAHGTTLGYLAGTDYLSLYGLTAAFAGETIDGTSVLVRYALYGDGDLDGGVSINDFNLLAANFGKTLAPAPVPSVSRGVAPAKSTVRSV